MRKLAGILIVCLGLIGMAGAAQAQFCPGVSPWVFDDVLASDPFCGFVTRMAQQNVSLGCAVIDANHRLFCPNDTVNRKQMAAFMARLGDALFPLNCASGQVMKWNGTKWACANDSAGPSNVFLQGGNGFGTIAILGTNDAQPLEVRVGGVRALRVERNGQTANIIAGSHDNQAAAGVIGATIAGGGGLTTSANMVGAHYGTIAGGVANDATGQSSSIGGGFGNAASGNSAVVAGGAFNVAGAESASVGGGHLNKANGIGSTVGGGFDAIADAQYSVVAGGRNNHATGDYSTISGGKEHTASAAYSAVLSGNANKATAPYATVLAGEANNANGPFSYVLGFRALTTSNATGSFVYSDSSAGEFGSGQPNEFLVGATGGIGLYTSKVFQSGCKIAAGGGQWNCFSSRDGKADFAAVDPGIVLDRVLALPISTWRYRGEVSDVRHLGPMAQDFHAAFGLGHEDTSIGVLDGNGVALAAIQGLHAQLRERDGTIALIRSQIEALAMDRASSITSMQRQLAELQAAIANLQGSAR